MSSQGRFIFDERPAKNEELDRLIKLSDFYHSYTLKILSNIKKNNEKKIHRIIDIGAGTGHTTILLKELFPNAQVTYFDLSRDLLQYSQELSSNHNVRLEFVRGEILSHKFDGKYDLVFSRFALKHIFNPRKAIQIMCGILEDQGVICLMDKDVYANIWYPRFPLYKTKLMDAINKYNEAFHRGGDSAIGRKMRCLLSGNSISVEHEELLCINLNDQKDKKIKLFKQIYIDVYKNLVPELVQHRLISKAEADDSIDKLIDFIENKKNTSVIVDFITWGRKNG